MSGKNIWNHMGSRWKKLRFREKCLRFDLLCLCIILLSVVCGAGRGKTIREEWQLMAWSRNHQESQAAQSQENVGESQGEVPQESPERAGDEKKKIALTFDDGPHPQYTPEMLEALKERNVKATFFLLGEEVEKYPEIVKQIQEEGHLIGNHSYKHEQLSKLPMEQACSQVTRTNELIYAITGVYPSYLRPPFGDWHEKLDGEVNMVEVLWDVDTLDWSSQNHSNIVNRAMKNLHENDIILMHDGYETSVTAAMEIIDTLQSQGYEFVTVDELIFE
ncbi:hypothetical protein C805_02745 [Eubacterium sp. 14-2]|uniref:polysaccharide deacetylase family protein n=1 Tax=Eubacterium sp. 14-2 TaxID=1235790 RepID=UPI000340C59E|nr:polysaccharide deacetylase family protein [Eubacterium sp. 14-2]EOT24533.1 hypothetical protein C805_02745 [Eubacterium sp. 14-2]